VITSLPQLAIARRALERLGTPKDKGWTPNWTHGPPTEWCIHRAWDAALFALRTGLPLGYLRGDGGLLVGGPPEQLEPAVVTVGLGYWQKSSNVPLVAICFHADARAMVSGQRNYGAAEWSERFTVTSWPRIREWLAQPATLRAGRK
jgi:hypothetical protein